MKVQSAVLAMALALGTMAGACSSSSNDNTGGAGGTGGKMTSGTGGSSVSCPEVTPCGGAIVGTWTAGASCLTLSGDVDPGALGLDPRTCTSAKIAGSLTVTGTFTATATSYTDATNTKGSAKIDLVKGCLMISGTETDCPGLARFIGGQTTCQNAASGGGCSCTLDVNQTGGLGIISTAPGKNDGYTTTSNTLALSTDAGDQSYKYCVSGNKLTVSPQSLGIPAIGTIELSKSGGGTGGSGGTGGGSGDTGGAGGTGGTASGGMIGTGGAGGKGGGVATGGSSAGGKGGGTPATGGAISGGGSSGTQGPCDIYAAGNTPCVAAYSMVRVLNSKYTGFLYQVRKGGTTVTDGSGANMKSGIRSGGTTQDIGAVNGYADVAAHEAFCDTACTVSKLYDQSGNANDLKVAPLGGYNDGSANLNDFESTAMKGIVMAGGHKAYSLYMGTREGYRLTSKGAKMPTGSASQGIYEVADGTHFGGQCCWDFGNVIADPTKYGTMNTLFFGTAGWGNGAGTTGPWFMADFEAGVWAGGSKPGDPGWGALSDAHPKNNMNPAMAVPFAMGILKTQTSKYALRSADVKTATDLTTSFEGALPKSLNNEGGILLGIGGDNSNHSYGTFFEGAIVAGYPTNDTELAVLKNVQAVGYSK